MSNYILFVCSTSLQHKKLANRFANYPDIHLKLSRVLENDCSFIYLVNLKTKYYYVDIEILISILPQNLFKAFSDWTDFFLSDECVSLRECISGLVFCCPCLELKNSEDLRTFVLDLKRARDRLVIEKYGQEDAELNLLLSPFVVFVLSVTEFDGLNLDQSVEEIVCSEGIEFIDLDKKSKSVFNDRTGWFRLIEVMETCEWPEITMKDELHTEKYCAQKRRLQSEFFSEKNL